MGNSPNITHKRGALSTEEQKFILVSKDSLSIEEIAKKLNRNPPPIQKFLNERKVPHKELSEEKKVETEIKGALRKKTFWPEIKKQFDRETNHEELNYFENTWVDLMKQFRSDVTTTEELEIKQYITLDILMNRSMKERTKTLEEIEKYEALVVKENKEPEPDLNKIQMYEGLIVQMRAAVVNFTKDHLAMKQQLDATSKNLKAVRSDRIKKIEDGKITFVGLLKQLDDDEQREREGMEAEIMRIAAEKAKREFSKLHKYEDGKIDQPFLTPETVLGDDNGETEE